MSSSIFDITILGIVEGLTEFIPVSSTGHLIIAEALLKRNDASASVFDIFIQIGAICAVLWARRARLIHMARGFFTDTSERAMAVKILIAFLPAALLGVMLHDFIKAVLFSPVVVATSLIVGGVFMLFAERISPRPRVETMDQLSYADSLKIGLCQTLSLIPGVSRAGASIVGARLLGVNLAPATEFSFFLAIPTIFGAAAFDLFKNRHLVTAADAPSFAIGTAVAFLSALVVVNHLIAFVTKHGFVPFGWYRIAVGIAVLGAIYAGVVGSAA